jgi:DNA-binding MarR family transcriptional regulator
MLFNNPVWNLGRLYHALTRLQNQQHAEVQSGVTADQHRLLAHLWKKDGMCQYELAHCTGRDRAGITRMVDILENAGVVERRADQRDRRLNLIYLTEAGHALKPLAEQVDSQALSYLMQNFSPEEKATFIHLLEKAIQNFD